MNHNELFDAMTNIDDHFILEAHEPASSSRIRFHPGGVRRAALIAAMIALTTLSALVVAAVSVDSAVVASFWNSIKNTIGYETYGVEENYIFNLNGTDYACLVYTTQSPDTALASIHLASGETLEVIYEAEILLPNGAIARKTLSKQGKERVTVYMTNTFDGVSGIILKTRVRFFRNTAEGERLLVSTWTDSLSEKYYQDAPEGYSSDWPDETGLAEARSHTYTVLPENSEVAVIITEQTD